MNLMIIWFASHIRNYGYKLANGDLVSINYNIVQSFTERVHIQDDEHIWNLVALLEDMMPKIIYGRPIGSSARPPY